MQVFHVDVSHFDLRYSCQPALTGLRGVAAHGAALLLGLEVVSVSVAARVEELLAPAGTERPAAHASLTRAAGPHREPAHFPADRPVAALASAAAAAARTRPHARLGIDASVRKS